MTVVVFDYVAWAARYPELAGSVPSGLASEYFAEAGLYLNNTDCSFVPADPTTQQPRKMLLNMLVAHIAALNAPINGNASSPLVGRISQATEGTVTVQATLDIAPGSAQWFAQSKYGLAFWQATNQYRRARYVPGFGQANRFAGHPWGRAPWVR